MNKKSKIPVKKGSKVRNCLLFI